MVRIGEDIYAIPLSQIEGIVRANPYELETYYAPEAPPFEYANIGYKLHYLGEFVHGVRVPSLFGQTLPLPILLVRGADQRVAIQVDQLIGSREIVVKSVGAQLASVAGISGATILGDGSVVIILDTVAMLRAASLQKPRQKQATEEVKTITKPERATRMVMVVDDSVTVRKVTSRLLERHGYEVVLAKDGLDAITKLEDVRPDIMLLDIEMPRMDGFEVASLVRHNPNLIGFSLFISIILIVLLLHLLCRQMVPQALVELDDRTQIVILGMFHRHTAHGHGWSKSTRGDGYGLHEHVLPRTEYLP